uniref:Uncharacterized protein n=1 Tax=viral metagenome TaxID=1070528 RepID=A0A6C0J252_9ZZZZ
MHYTPFYVHQEPHNTFFRDVVMAYHMKNKKLVITSMDDLLYYI